MTPLIRARHHAQVVEDLEPCAPEVQSRYLREAIERCKLPISVTTGKDAHGYFLAIQDRRQMEHVPFRDRLLKRWNAGWPHLTSDPRDATAAYFRLVSTFTDPAAHAPLARTAASLSAAANSTVTPGVSSSSTAAPAAVDAPVPPHGESAAEFTPLGSATTSGVR